MVKYIARYIIVSYRYTFIFLSGFYCAKTGIVNIHSHALEHLSEQRPYAFKQENSLDQVLPDQKTVSDRAQSPLVFQYY